MEVIKYKKKLERLIKNRNKINEKLDKVKDKMKKYGDEVCLIDSDIKQLMLDNEVKQEEINGNKCFFEFQTAAKIIDIKKFLSWISKSDSNYETLRADIIKKTEINKLITKGIVPEGIMIHTWEEFKVHKSRKSELV